MWWEVAKTTMKTLLGVVESPIEVPTIGPDNQ